MAKCSSLAGGLSGDFAEIFAEEVPVDAWGFAFHGVVGLLPDRESAGQEGASLVGEDQDAAAAVGRIFVDFDEATAFEGFERCSQRSAVYRE
jgi:hypothetical protein